MKNGLSVIIVTYKPGGELIDCIKSIVEKIKCDYEIIISDNSCEYNSILESVEADFSPKILFNEKNGGYGYAINLAAKCASFDNLLIINPDAVVVSNISLEVFDELICPGIVSAICFDENGSYKKTVGIFPNKPSLLIKFSNRLRSDCGFYDGVFEGKPINIDYSEGSFYLIKKSTFDLVCGFDENIFLYGEDYEFSYRVASAGFKNYFLPNVKYMHVGGYSDSREPHIVNGLVYFARKHCGFINFALIKIVLFLRYSLLLFLNTFKYFLGKNNRLPSIFKALKVVLNG